MSNLRWIVRDGKEVLQQFKGINNEGEVYMDVPLVSEPPKKSLAQVLYEAFEKPHINWGSSAYQHEWARVAQAAIAYLEAEGWKRPSGNI